MRRHLGLQRRPGRLGRSEVERLHPLAVGQRSSPAPRRTRASPPSPPGWLEHLGEHALAARGPRSALDLLEDRGADAAAPVVRVHHHVGVGDREVVVHAAGSPGRRRPASPVGRTSKSSTRSSDAASPERDASDSQDGIRSVRPMGLGRAPHVVPLAEPGLVAGVDVPDLEHASTLGEASCGPARRAFRGVGQSARRRRTTSARRSATSVASAGEAPRPSPAPAARCRTAAAAPGRCRRASPARGRPPRRARGRRCGSVSTPGTLTSTCGSRVTTEASSRRDDAGREPSAAARASAVRMPSPVVAWSRMMMWPGLLAAEREAAVAHRLEHVAVADGGLVDGDAGAPHRLDEAEVAHHRGHDRVVGEAAALVQVEREHRHQLVAVDASRRCGRRRGSGRRRRRGRSRRPRRAPSTASRSPRQVGRPAALVDVEPVGLVVDRDHRRRRPRAAPAARPRTPRRSRSRARRGGRPAAGRGCRPGGRRTPRRSRRTA